MTFQQMEAVIRKHYETHDALCYGDYGGSGYVGEANIEFLVEHYGEFHTLRGNLEMLARAIESGNAPSLLVETGSHRHHRAWIHKESEDGQDFLRRVNGEYLLDENRARNLEDEYLADAWTDCGENLIRQEVCKDAPWLEAMVDELIESGEFSGAYYDCCREYPYCEGYQNNAIYDVRDSTIEALRRRLLHGPGFDD